MENKVQTNGKKKGGRPAKVARPVVDNWVEESPIERMEEKKEEIVPLSPLDRAIKAVTDAPWQVNGRRTQLTFSVPYYCGRIASGFVVKNGNIWEAHSVVNGTRKRAAHFFVYLPEAQEWVKNSVINSIKVEL